MSLASTHMHECYIHPQGGYAELPGCMSELRGQKRLHVFSEIDAVSKGQKPTRFQPRHKAAVPKGLGRIQEEKREAKLVIFSEKPGCRTF